MPERARLRRLRLATVAAALATALAAVLLSNWDSPLERLAPAFFLDDLLRAAEAEGLDPLLVASVVHVESGFRHDAVSRVGARGLMQVMPATAAEVAAALGSGALGADTFTAAALDDPATNLRIGARYLRLLVDEFGDVRLALAAYNGGPGAVRAWRAEGGRRIEDFPKAETRRYVAAVVRTWHVARGVAHLRSALRVPKPGGPRPGSRPSAPSI